MNSVYRFALADPTAGVPFSVDANTGVISVSGALDYETAQSYSFMVHELFELFMIHLHSYGITLDYCTRDPNNRNVVITSTNRS